VDASAKGEVPVRMPPDVEAVRFRELSRVTIGGPDADVDVGALRHRDAAQCRVLRRPGVNRPVAKIEQQCVGLVREKIGPVAAFKLAIAVARLPKARSGKILRGTMKKIADGEAWTMPATIDDPAILEEIGAVLKGKGVRA
jgi:hypothetical protein